MFAPLPVNVGLLSWAGYNLYTKPQLRQNSRLLATGAAATLALFGAEGYAAEWYRKTPRGQEEERKAKNEGALLFKHVHEVVLRPGVLGGLLGLGERHRPLVKVVDVLIDILQ